VGKALLAVDVVEPIQGLVDPTVQHSLRPDLVAGGIPHLLEHPW